MLYPDYSRAYLLYAFPKFRRIFSSLLNFLFSYFADGFYLKISDRLQLPADPSFWFFFIWKKYWFFISGGILLLFFFKPVLSKFMFICNFLSALNFEFFFLFFPLPREFYFVKQKKIKYTCNSLLCLSAGRWRWCEVIFSWRV